VPLVTLVTHKTLGRVRRDAAVLGMVFLEEPQSEHAPTLGAAKAEREMELGEALARAAAAESRAAGSAEITPREKRNPK
jgi:hypothetical protein